MTAQEQVANEAVATAQQDQPEDQQPQAGEPQAEQKEQPPKNDKEVAELADEIDNLDLSKEKRRPKRSDSERERIWEEEQRQKEVVETAVKGTVKWYSILGRYGFIQRADGKDDLFVHQTAISKSTTVKRYLRTLADEEEVLFDVVQGKKGLEAANVSGPEGNDVQGSRHRYLLLYKNRRFRNRNANKKEEEEKSASNEANAEVKEVSETPKSEKQKKRRQQRKNKKAAEKTATENPAMANDDAPTLDVCIDKLRELELHNDRCDSAFGDASLGAQSIDAQV